jgi:exopolysaccharide biosynthesis polyprenyl glycosylphosphotransferase
MSVWSGEAPPVGAPWAAPPSFLARSGKAGVARSRSVNGYASVVQLVVDLIAAGGAMLLAYRLRQRLPAVHGFGRESFLLGTSSLPVWAAMLWRARLYSPPHTAGRLDEFRRVIRATLSTCGAIAILGFVFKIDIARGWLVLTAIFGSVALTLGRSLTRRYFARLRSQGRLLRPVVLVGANVEALALCAMLVADPRLGYRVVGFVDDESPPGRLLLEGQRVLGGVTDTLFVARAAGATGVIIATTAAGPAVSNRLTRELTEAGMQVELSSSLCDISAERLFLRPLGRFPVVHVDPVHRHGWQALAKRGFDVAVAAAVGVVAAPFIAVAAAAIKLNGPGPVHFRQKRVGKDGKPFEVLKLRTMVDNAEQLVGTLMARNQADGPLFKMKRDPRVTSVGRVLRALSIDELPQLWNVLRGDMSLVGPRPALPSEVPLWSPELHGRLAVKPGMTGMWQVSGSRRWHSFDEYARLDLYYVDNWSIWTDLAILVKTVPAVLFNRPAKKDLAPQGALCPVP